MNIFQDYIYIQNNYPKYKNFFRIPEKDLVSLDTRNIFWKDFCFEVSPKNKKIQEYTKLWYKYFISINNSKDLESVKWNIHPHGYIFYLQNNKKFISEIKTFIWNQKQKCFILFSFEKVGDSAIKQLRPTVWDLRRKAKEKKLELDDNFIRIQSAKRNIFILGPKEINLDISEICNAQCIFCYTNGSIFKTEKKKQLHSLTKKNLEFLSFIWVEGISLWITWEPMLDNLQIKRLFQDIDWIDISLSFLTNGYSIIDHIKEIYKNIHIKDFIINIWAGDPKNFLLSRPKDTIINFYKINKTWYLSHIEICRYQTKQRLIRKIYRKSTEI